MITTRTVLMAIIKDSVTDFLEDSGTTKTTSDEVKVLITCMSNMVGILLDPSEIDEVCKYVGGELKGLFKKKEPRKKK